MVALKVIELPTELLIAILYDLDGQDLYICKQVCRLFLELVEQSIQLQYKLELALAGMEDEPSCNLSFATKLEKLRALQESWRDLKLSPGPSIPFTEHGLWSFSGGLYAAVNPAGDLNFVQIPCRIRGTEERRWTIDGTDIGIPVTYMRIDQAQDLLVLLEAVEDRTNTSSSSGAVHILSLSGHGAPHPLASHSRLQARLPNPRYVYTIRIEGDVIGYMGGYGFLQVWNWKTGDTVWAGYGLDRVESFVFLDDHHIIVPGEDEIIVYGFDPHIVFEGTHEDDWLCRLRLPPPCEYYYTIELTTDETGIPHPSMHHPFHRSLHHALIRITVLVHTPENDTVDDEKYDILVPSSTIRKCLGDVRAQSWRDISWLNWGPMGTRIITMPFEVETWASRVQGSRAIIASQEDQESEINVNIYEFNTLVLKRELRERLEAESVAAEIPAGVYVTEPNEPKFSHREVFEGTVTTSLPYRMSEAQIPAGDGQVMVDMMDDGIFVRDRDGTRGTWNVYLPW